MIQSVEDAHKYVDAVKEHLDELITLSQDAGLHTHAAIWCALCAAFLGGPEEIKVFSDFIETYLKTAIHRHLRRPKNPFSDLEEIDEPEKEERE